MEHRGPRSVLISVILYFLPWKHNVQVASNPISLWGSWGKLKKNWSSARYSAMRTFIIRLDFIMESSASRRWHVHFLTQWNSLYSFKDRIRWLRNHLMYLIFFLYSVELWSWALEFLLCKASYYFVTRWLFWMQFTVFKKSTKNRIQRKLQLQINLIYECNFHRFRSF